MVSAGGFIRPGGYLVYHTASGEDWEIIILVISHPAQQRPYDDA